MTAPASVYPRTVDELLPNARALPLRDGEQAPSRNRLMREFRIGAPKADEVRAQLLAEHERRQQAEEYRLLRVIRGDISDPLPSPTEPADGIDVPLDDPTEPADVPEPEPAVPVEPTTPGTATPDPQVRVDGHPGTLRQLKRIRWGVRLVLILGVAASVAGNVLHADDRFISQVISAWSPLALLLTIELISRVPVHTRALGVVRWIATGLIAGIAAWVSYWHMASVASEYGESGGSQYLLPLSVDGLVVVASVCLVELGRRIVAHVEVNR